MYGALDELLAKQHKLIRAQQPDPNHSRLANHVVNEWAPKIGHSGDVLDVGCGQAIAKQAWEINGFRWHGAAIGSDVQVLANRGIVVQQVDMHAVTGSYDVVFARHVLEHSPVPALALRVWRDIAPFAIVVVPAMWPGAFNNIGHINVLPLGCWRPLMHFAGWNEVEYKHVFYDNPPPWIGEGSEYRFLLRRYE